MYWFTRVFDLAFALFLLLGVFTLLLLGWTDFSESVLFRKGIFLGDFWALKRFSSCLACFIYGLLLWSSLIALPVGVLLMEFEVGVLVILKFLYRVIFLSWLSVLESSLQGR